VELVAAAMYFCIAPAVAAPMPPDPIVSSSFFDWDEYFNSSHYDQQEIIVSQINGPGLPADTKYDWGASILRQVTGEGRDVYKMWWTRKYAFADGTGRDTIHYAESWDAVNWY